MRRPSTIDSVYANRLARVGDYVRLVHEVVLAGEQIRAQEILERLELEGLLTNRLLDDLINLPGVRPNIVTMLRRRRDSARGTHPSTAGVVWTLAVPEAHVFSGSSGQLLAIPCLVRCFVSAGQTVPLTTIRTRNWSEDAASLRRVLFVIDRVVSNFSPVAQPGWSRDRTRCDLTFLGETLAVNAADRSHELAVSLAVMSAALDVELEPGTVVFGRVCTLPEEARNLQCDLGAVLSLGDESIWLKLAGMIHALPIATKVYSSFHDAEFIRAHLPKDRQETIEVVGVASIQDIPRLIGADPSRFRGRRRINKWQRLYQLGMSVVDWGVTPAHEIRREMSVRRDDARARFGRILGEQCAIPSFLSATILASILASSLGWKASGIISLMCPLIFSVVSVASLRVIGLHHLEDRLAVRTLDIEELAATLEKERKESVTSQKKSTPGSELRDHISGVITIWIIWLSMAVALWGGSIFDGSGWRVLSVVLFLVFSIVAMPIKKNDPEHFLAFELPALHAFRRRWTWFGFIAWIACLFSPSREGLAAGAAVVSVYLILLPSRLSSRRTPGMIALQMYRNERSRRAVALFLIASMVIPSLESPSWLASAWTDLLSSWDGLPLKYRAGAAAFFSVVGLLHYRRGLIDYSENLAPDLDETMLRSQESAGKLKGGFPAIDPLVASQGLFLQGNPASKPTHKHA